MKRLITVAASCALFGGIIACTSSNESTVKNQPQQPQITEEKKYSCWLDDDFDDWSVNITLSQTEKTAQFFDNDHWSDLDDRYEFKRLTFSPPTPPQMQHTFEGEDSMTDEVVYEFVFNETLLTGTLYEMLLVEGKVNNYAMSCELDAPPPPKSCQDTLGKDHTMDARSWNIDADDFEGELDDAASALKLVKMIASSTGCDGATVELQPSQNTPASGCSEIVPGDRHSHVCFVSTNFGYFIANETYPNGLAVTWSRWD